MAKVIKRTNVNPWGQTFGVLGQGVGGFTDGMMAKKMLDMWGKMGEKITPPVAGAAGQPTSTPATQPTSALPNDASGANSPYAGISTDDLQKLLNLTLNWSQGGVA